MKKEWTKEKPINGIKEKKNSHEFTNDFVKAMRSSNK